MTTAGKRLGVWGARLRLPQPSPFLALLVLGCAATPPPRVYLLSPPAQNLAEPRAGAVQLKSVILPDYLDTTDMMLRIAPHEVQVSATAQWAERLSAGITRALRADLTARMPGTRVAAGQPIDGAASRLLVTIDALDMWPDGSCVLAAHWAVGTLAGQGQFTVPASDHPTDERRVADLAALIDRLAARIAGSI